MASTADEPSTSERQESSRILYIGHLPHGFYEKQLQGFFSQFGDVKRLKVSRSKKTGKSKHYAFVEFKSPQVAAIAGQAMDGYMMFTQKLDCHVLKASEVHKDLFKGTSRTFKKIPWDVIEQKRHNKPRTVTQQAERIARALSRDKRRKARLEAADIEYEYTTLSEALEKPAKKKARKGDSGKAVDLATVVQAPLKKTKRKAGDRDVGKKTKKSKKLAESA